MLQPSPEETGQQRDLFGLALRGLYFGAEEHSGYAAARYYDLLRRASAALATGTLLPDIDADCLSWYGVSVTDLTALAVFLAAPFVSSGQTPLPSVVLSRARGEADVTKALTRPETLNLFVASRQELRERFDDGNPLALSSFTPLAATPFYRTEAGTVIPINQRLMIDKVTVGAYWELHKGYRQRSLSAVKQYVGAIGKRALEPYVDGVLSRSVTAGALHLTGADQPSYRSTGVSTRRGRSTRVEGSDSYIWDGSCLIVFEVTASGFPITSLVSGDSERLISDFNGKILEKFSQLDRVLGDLLRGELQLPGVSLDALQYVIPVVVVLDSFPNFPTVWAQFDAILNEHQLFRFEEEVCDVSHVIVLTVEEVEMVEPLITSGETTWARLLREFAGDHLSSRGSLKNVWRELVGSTCE
jgi:hypothetical protein